ncbi:MAG: hypothetical protein ACJ779_10250 [Chloroflexota bacterium]
MARRLWLLVGALAVAAVVFGAAFVTRQTSDATPSPSRGAVTSSPAAVATSSLAPSDVPTPTTSTAEPTETPASATASAQTPIGTPPPARASGPAGAAYAAFLRRVNDDRATVERLNAALSSGAQAQDPAAVKAAAVDILDFVDSERDWLRENPPAACYADAHASAGAMLDSYGAAADAFIAWAGTGGGLAGLGALGKAVDAAQTASDALTTFGHSLETTSCPA